MEEEYIYTVGATNRSPQIQDESAPSAEDIFLFDTQQNRQTLKSNEEDLEKESQEEIHNEESSETTDEVDNNQDQQEKEDDTDDFQNEDDTDDTDDDEETSDETQSDNKFEDYSVSAIYAERLKEIEFLPKDYETKKDLDHVEFLDTLIAKSEEVGLKNAEAAFIEKYGGEEVLQAAQFLNQGGDPVLLNKRSALDHFLNLDTEDDENAEKVIRFAFKMKGIEKDDAEIFLETIKERGELNSKALKSTKELLNIKANYNETINKPPVQSNSKELIEQRNNKITGIISKSDLGPFKLDSKEQKRLQDFIMKPAYATKVNVNGVVKNKFITGLERAYQRLHSDLDKQVLLAKLLMDDFDFKPVKDQGKDEATASVLDHLNRKTKKRKTNSKKTNAYLRS